MNPPNKWYLYFLGNANIYEKGHKKVLGIWIDLEQKVKYSTILVFKVIFLCQKSAETF